MTITNERKLYEVDKVLYPTCRYRKLRRYVNDSGKEMPESYEAPNLPISSEDRHYTVKPGEENCLDLIAMQSNHYNNEDLWWVVAEASNIIDPLDVPIGTVLRVPTLTSLYRLGGILS